MSVIQEYFHVVKYSQHTHVFQLDSFPPLLLLIFFFIFVLKVVPKVISKCPQKVSYGNPLDGTFVCPMTPVMQYWPCSIPLYNKRSQYFCFILSFLSLIFLIFREIWWGGIYFSGQSYLGSLVYQSGLLWNKRFKSWGSRHDNCEVK